MTDQSFADDSGNKNTEENKDNKTLSAEEVDKILTRDRHAQQHIKTLEAERAADRAKIETLQQALDKARTVEDLLERMQTQARYTNDNSTDETTSQGKGFNVDQLVSEAERRVLDTLTSRERELKEKNNWNTVVSKLSEQYGDNFKAKVVERANVLGLEISEFDRLAKTSPNAFFELLGDTKVKGDPRPTTSSVTRQTTTSPNARLEELMALRKKDINAFYSPEVQKELRTLIPSGNETKN